MSGVQAIRGPAIVHGLRATTMESLYLRRVHNGVTTGCGRAFTLADPKPNVPPDGKTTDDDVDCMACIAAEAT